MLLSLSPLFSPLFSVLLTLTLLHDTRSSDDEVLYKHTLKCDPATWERSFSPEATAPFREPQTAGNGGDNIVEEDPYRLKEATSSASDRKPSHSSEHSVAVETPSIERLELLRDLISDINEGKQELRDLKGASKTVVEQPLDEPALRYEEEIEDKLYALRGRLSHILDQPKSMEKHFSWIPTLENSLSGNEKEIWNAIMKSEDEAKKSQGISGYFYSLWTYFFDHANWEKQQLAQSLRQIRIQLRIRPPENHERTVLRLEKVAAAGLAVSPQERKMAQAIAPFAPGRFDPFDHSEFLKEMRRRTVRVRRQEQVDALVVKIQKEVERLNDMPHDYHLIYVALAELAEKEKEGILWTKQDEQFLNAVGVNFDRKSLKRRRSMLNEIMTKIKRQKALSVLDANAYRPMDSQQQLHLKLKDPNSALTEDMKEVTQLATQYYRMKQQLETPLHHDLIRRVHEEMKNHGLSNEQCAIRWLEEERDAIGIDPGQAWLLERLKTDIIPVSLSDEDEAKVQHYLKDLTKIEDSVKAKELEEALQDLPEVRRIEDMDQYTKARLYDEVVTSRPVSELWAYLHWHSALTYNDKKKFIAAKKGYFTFMARCQVLLLSEDFRKRNPAFRSLKSLAHERLYDLEELSNFNMDPQLEEMFTGLIQGDLKILSNPQVKKAIYNLATEQALLKVWKPTPEDQHFLRQLARDPVSILEDPTFRTKLAYLVPEEHEQLSSHLISLNENEMTLDQPSLTTRNVFFYGKNISPAYQRCLLTRKKKQLNICTPCWMRDSIPKANDLVTQLIDRPNEDGRDSLFAFTFASWQQQKTDVNGCQVTFRSSITLNGMLGYNKVHNCLDVA
ncbi:hypothetical protein PCANC_13088 [Puccinia coronata f. sp. avenae]|uniref:Uncharacterized protein n=1 Tax=Puccinia coronata f. sp. avenae TaxID=200324 RepID=A0A2N5UUR8_9BASI|nr:hypothetical protein PCANC_13088 [Puccinia coronata f. sp. avenae]